MNTENVMKVISMLESCAVWAVIFIVVLIISNYLGVTKNLPRESKRRLADLAKVNDAYIKKMGDDKPDHEKDLVRSVKKLKRASSYVSKIFDIYAYDHPLMQETNYVKDTLDKIHHQCTAVSVCISRNKYEDIEEHLRKIEELIPEADKQIDRVITLDDEEKIIHA